uniref:Uncharacterized protein n=1 Tax=Arundo donax TaxID=35708 RepID=A0A0A8Y6N6_ARUDO
MDLACLSVPSHHRIHHDPIMHTYSLMHTLPPHKGFQNKKQLLKKQVE